MGDTTPATDLQGAFTESAPRFAALDAVLWDPVATATLTRSRPGFGELVLDACSGDGATALPSAELVGPTGLVDAIDFAASLAEIARERATDRLPQLRVHVADVLEWETTGYDLVQCVLGVFFFDDLDGGVRHLIERARPGGRVAITIWADGAWSGLPAAVQAAVEAEDRTVPDRPGAAAASGLGTPGALAAYLHAAGLTGVRADLVRRSIDLDEATMWALVEGTLLRSMLAGLKKKGIARVRKRVWAALMEAAGVGKGSDDGSGSGSDDGSGPDDGSDSGSDVSGETSRSTVPFDLSVLIAVGRRPHD